MTSDDRSNDAPEIPGGRGGTLRPWQPGQSGNPEGMNRARREAYRLARLAAPHAVQTLIDRMTDPAEDSRVKVVAAQAVLDRGLGKATDQPPDDSDAVRIDLSHLTEAERIELSAALATIKRLTGRTIGPVPPVQIYLPDNNR